MDYWQTVVFMDERKCLIKLSEEMVLSSYGEDLQKSGYLL